LVNLSRSTASILISMLGCISDINPRRGGPVFLFNQFKKHKPDCCVLTGTTINATTRGLLKDSMGSVANFRGLREMG
jgi:hypothetical protein